MVSDGFTSRRLPRPSAIRHDQRRYSQSVQRDRFRISWECPGDDSLTSATELVITGMGQIAFVNPFNYSQRGPSGNRRQELPDVGTSTSLQYRRLKISSLRRATGTGPIIRIEVVGNNFTGRNYGIYHGIDQLTGCEVQFRCRRIRSKTLAANDFRRTSLILFIRTSAESIRSGLVNSLFRQHIPSRRRVAFC